jgi:hypothetical protein
MHRLGYTLWGAQVGDWGAAVTTTLGHLAPPGLIGIHLNMVMFQPSEEERAEATPDEQEMLNDAQRYDQQFSGYYKLQNSRPQSIGFSLADSPVGLAAWIYALFQDVSDSGGEPERVFTLDQMLDDIMLYWLPNTGASSARLYWEGMQEMMSGGMPPSSMQLPTGISMFPGEQVRLSRRWAERRFANLVHFNQMDHGGHFRRSRTACLVRGRGEDDVSVATMAQADRHHRPERRISGGTGMTNQPVIALAGASGDLGFRIARALVERGAEVRALVRPDVSPKERARLEAIASSAPG